MRTHPAFLALLTACVLTLSLGACGGGGGGSSSPSTPSAPSVGSSTTNVATITVGAPLSGRRPNLPFVNVTICVPGTSTCQTINNILVDTGSVGLRLLSSAVSISLPAVTTPSGDPLAECLQFVSTYSWGAIRSANYTVGGESTTAPSSIQIIGDGSVPATVPTSCTSNGGTAANTVASFGANGLLGVGLFQQDCGAACATTVIAPAYYDCPSTSSSCTSVAVPTTQQVQHPATLFGNDNNGTIIVLPSVSADGATSATGQLIFGIGTESDNAISASTVISTDSSGRFTVNYGTGPALTNSFLDSGSNGIFFNDSTITQCASNSVAPNFYCPASTLTLGATLVSPTNSGQTGSISFNVANAVTLLTNNSQLNQALPGLAGVGSTNSFDLGLPFYYGRSVYTAIEGRVTTAGTGPFVAF